MDQMRSGDITRLADGSVIVSSDPSYGFLIENVQAQGIMRSNCDLETIGDLGQRHYGLAFPKGSKLRDKVSKQILEYSEQGILFQLKNKWFNLAENCSDGSKNQSNQDEDVIVRALPYRKRKTLLGGRGNKTRGTGAKLNKRTRNSCQFKHQLTL